MHSSMIGKIQKARWYAEEPDRLNLTRFTATFRGEHDVYQLEYDAGKWQCDCNFFGSYGVCSHTMATERILSGRLAKAEQESSVEVPQPAGA